MKPGSPRARPGLDLRFWLVLVVLSTVLSGVTSAQDIPLHSKIKLRVPLSHVKVSNVDVRRSGASTLGQSTACRIERGAFQARVGDTLTVSGLLTDRLTGDPMRVYLIVGLKSPSTTGYGLERDLSAHCLADSSGRFKVSLSTDTAYPDSYSLCLDTHGRILYFHYEKEYKLDLWDSSAIRLHPFTDESGTKLKGQLLTAHGLPVRRAPVSITVNGRQAAALTTDESGGFACELDLRPGKHTIAARFPGVPFVEPCETVITYDPTLYYWSVVLEESAGRVVLPERLTVLTVRVEGTPPYRDLALSFTATAVETGRASRLQVAPAGVSGQQQANLRDSIPITAAVNPVALLLPAVPGSYVITAEADPEGPHRLADIVAATVSVWAPTSLDLRLERRGAGESLVGMLTSLGSPLSGEPWTILQNGQPHASGVSAEDGSFVLEGPLPRANYIALYSPEPGRYYLPSRSEVVNLTPFPWTPLVAAGAVLAAVPLGWTLVRPRWRRHPPQRRLRHPVTDLEESSPPEAPDPRAILEILPPREQIILLYEALVVPVLSRVASPDPTRGQWHFWRRVCRSLPEACDALAGLISLYQEARYSRHVVTPHQVAEARRLAADVVAIAAASVAEPPAGDVSPPASEGSPAPAGPGEVER